MNPKAIEKARQRVDRAQAAWDTMIAAGAAKDRPNVDVAVQRAAWTDFLLAANGAYSMLLAGAKGDPASVNRLSRYIQRRKDDPILAYLQQARNAEEHGLDDVLRPEVNISIGSAVSVTPILRLIPVTDKRSGKTYTIPTMINGMPVVSRTLTYIGGFLLGEIKQMVEDAATWPYAPQDS